MKKTLIALFMMPLIAVAQTDTVYVEVPVIYGCMWPNSCNYNDEATVDDGSCLDCTTPYEVGELLCDYYHGVDGIWAAWVAWKCGVIEPPIASCDTVYVQLPADTVEVFEYIQLSPDTVLSISTVDCVTGMSCEGCDYNVYMPSYFTPNDDGVNDLFCPIADSYCWDKLEYRIYDRWGNLVFIGDLLRSVCWNGVGASQGIYVWTLHGESEENIVSSGSVLLLR